MKVRTTFWYCSAILGLLSVSAYGQSGRAFMDAAGNGGAGQPTTGSTLITMTPGSCTQINAYVVDESPTGTLMTGYQLIFQCTSTGGDSGSVDYTDNNPGMGGGDSILVDTTRPDWVFENSIAVNPNIIYNETCMMANIFGVIYNTAIPLDDKDINATFGDGAAYMAEFEVCASADACGLHTFQWNIAATGVPPFAALFAPGGAQWFSDDAAVPVEFQPLDIFIGPLNDDCGDAQDLGSAGQVDVAYDTTCGTLDGDESCGTGADIWYAYSTPNECLDGLIVTLSGGGDVSVHQTGSCTPAGGACNPGPIANAGGESWLIQVQGDNVSGTLSIECGGCTVAADCDDGNDCTDDACLPNGQCQYTNNNDPCSDGDPCTLGDTCGMGSCNSGPIDECNDFNPCTADSCESGVGCMNVDVNGQACSVDDDCNAGASVDGATCDAGACACTSGMVNALCLELRDPKDDGTHQQCGTDGDNSQCPSGELCIDGTCLPQACYAPGEEITVDLELFPTPEDVACGGQFFLEYDTSCLTLQGLETDPDGELGWSFVFVNQTGDGTIDLALGISPAQQCCIDGGNPLCAGSSNGGTIARLTFTSDGSDADSCKCGGVDFRVHNPPTGVSGPKGDIGIGGCNDDADPSGTDSMRIQPDTELSGGLDADIESGSDCGSIFKSVTYDAVTVSDPCAEAGATADCVVSFNSACETGLDCGMGDLCNSDADCGPYQCVEDAAAGELGFTGFCATDNCVGGVCESGSVPVGVDLNDYLDCSDGCDFLPGLTCVSCSYTNGCGNSSNRDFCVFNSGLNKLLVDVELSPTMVDGTPGDPIVRCIDFHVSACDASTFFACSSSSPTPGALCFPQDQNACGGFPEMCVEQSSGGFDISANVVFGSPENIPGHGQACLKVPPGNWDCIEATDPKHSLTASCSLECNEDGVLRATFKGSKATHETCHWLVQGNLDGNPNIDIFDYTILAGEYLNNYGSNDTLCKTGDVKGNNFNADFNGDKIVTLADWSFVVFNFFCASKDPCSALCDPAPSFDGVGTTKTSKPRSSVTMAELREMGLESYGQAADVNNDGTVDLTDMSLFLEGEDAPEDLREQVKKAQRSHRERILPRAKRTR